MNILALQTFYIFMALQLPLVSTNVDTVIILLSDNDTVVTALLDIYKIAM